MFAAYHVINLWWWFVLRHPFCKSFHFVVMSVVCFGGGFAFESRVHELPLLPVKSYYVCFCEFLPVSSKKRTWDRSCENPFGSSKPHELGVVEQGVYFDNSNLPSTGLYRTFHFVSCHGLVAIFSGWFGVALCLPFNTNFIRIHLRSFKFLEINLFMVIFFETSIFFDKLSFCSHPVLRFPIL